MSKKRPNMVPKWAQVGVMLGSKIVLDVSKGETKRIPEAIRKKGQKSIKNLRSGRLPDGKCRGCLVVIERLLGPTTNF